MADADFTQNAVQNRDIRLTDLVLGLDPAQSDAAVAARADTLTELIARIFQNPPSTLTTDQQAALRTLLAVLTEAEVDARAVARYTNTEKTKLGNLPDGTAGIVTALEGLSGNDRLNATTAIRMIADALDTELGSTTWRQGGMGGSNDGVINALTLALAGSNLTATAGRSVGADVVSAALTLPFLLLTGGTLSGTVSGVTPTADAHLATKAYVDAAVANTPLTHPTLLGGLSDDATPTAAELTIMGSMSVLTFASFTAMRILIARLASEGDITSIISSNDQSNTNQIGAYTKFGSNVTVDSDDYAVWVSNQILTFSDGFTLTVR